MSRIFISYAHDDSAFASKLANDLLDKGYDVWLDTLNLPGGASWDTDIMQAIDACHVFLLVWTANIEGSSYSQKEKDRALEGGKKIIPIYCKGDKSRMWPDITQFQWIDFADDVRYSASLKRLMTDLPNPTGMLTPPNLKQAVSQGDTTFNAMARMWRSKLRYRNKKGEITALLIDRDVSGVQSYLVGYDQDKIQTPRTVQLFMNFSGSVAEDRFEDYLNYIAASNLPLWTVLVRGPIASTTRGLSYALPNDPTVWQSAVNMMLTSVGKVSTASTPIHLYMNAPVALGSAYCASLRLRRWIHIYHVNFSVKADREDERYFEVMHVDGGS